MPFAGVLACFVLSGFAALLYQTAWLREFSLVFGTSELAVATVLAAYMAGLGAGAAVVARYVRRVQRPLFVYGVLELGIALGALAVPLLLALARRALALVIGGMPEPPASGSGAASIFYLACTFVIVGLPTGLMGATLPLLARQVVHSDEQVGRRVGLLYALNTAGAVLGTLVAAFVLLPRLGLRGTVWVGVAANALVFAVAAFLARGAAPVAADEAAAPASAPEPASGRLERNARLVLPLMLVSGAISFGYEVLWTRLLSQLLGGSVYSFATMLASFLTGITLGSALAGKLATTRQRAAVGLVVAQLLIALFSLGTFLGLELLPGIALSMSGDMQAGLGTNATLAALVLLPSTLCIGATFPFALRLLARDESDAARASARVYAWNTLGAIVGAVLAGFWLLPALAFDGSARWLVAASLVLALGGAAAWLEPAKKPVIALAPVLVIVVALFRPGPPDALLRATPVAGLHADGERLYSAVGRSATVQMMADGGLLKLWSNGLQEANISLKGAPTFGRNAERWLTVLPVLARPSVRQMLVVGFGGGIALEDVPASVATIDVIELEPEVIAANRAVASLRQRDPLADPRLRLFMNDVRGALALTDKRWDAIVSQPSQPWTAGASHLFTREFFRQVRDHLTPGGVFVQWCNVSFLDEQLLRILGATVLDVFPNVRLYWPSANMLVFLASDAPLSPERDVAAGGGPLAAAPQDYARIGIESLDDLALMLALEHDGLAALCAGAPVSTDDKNYMALEASRHLGRADDTEIDRVVVPREAVVSHQSALATELDPRLDRVYMALRLLDLNMGARAWAMADSTVQPARRELARSRLFARQGRGQEALHALERAFQLDPADPEVLYAVVEPALGALEKGGLSPAVTESATRLSGAAGAVVEGWRLVERQSRWESLSALDARLAEARPTDLWFLAATRLRTMWRESIDDGARRAREALVSLELVDRALVLQPDPLLFAARLNAAVIAGRAPEAVESAAVLCMILLPAAPAGPPGGILGQSLANFFGVLPALEQTRTVPAWRVDEVRRQGARLFGQP